MKLFSVLLVCLSLVSCGYFEGEDGKDGSSIPGPAGENGQNGADAVVKVTTCSIELLYGSTKTKMVYIEQEYNDGHSEASLRQYDVETLAVVTQASADFEAGVKPWLESPNWKVQDQTLIFKPKPDLKYDWKCE